MWGTPSNIWYIGQRMKWFDLHKTVLWLQENAFEFKQAVCSKAIGFSRSFLLSWVQQAFNFKHDLNCYSLPVIPSFFIFNRRSCYFAKPPCTAQYLYAKRYFFLYWLNGLLHHTPPSKCSQLKPHHSRSLSSSQNDFFCYYSSYSPSHYLGTTNQQSN